MYLAFFLSSHDTVVAEQYKDGYLKSNQASDDRKMSTTMYECENRQHQHRS